MQYSYSIISLEGGCHKPCLQVTIHDPFTSDLSFLMVSPEIKCLWFVVRWGGCGVVVV